MTKATGHAPTLGAHLNRRAVNDAHGVIDVRIEMSSGDAHVYAVGPGAAFVDLRHTHYADQMYPADWAVVPATLTTSGDPLGVVLLTDIACSPGAMVPARLVGVVVTGGDPILLAVLATDQHYQQITSWEAVLAERREAVEGLLAPGIGQDIRFGGPQEARDVLHASRQAARLAQAEAHAHAHRPPAWRVSGSSKEIYTSAEWSVPQLPLRFQECAGKLLMPRERILAFVPRPFWKSAGSLLFQRRQHRNEGLLILTDQQVLWLEDVLPPSSGVASYGYLARTAPLERLAGVHLIAEDKFTRLTIMFHASGAPCSMSATFPAASIGVLRRLARIVEDFLPGQSAPARLMRLAQPPADEAPFCDLVESGDVTSLQALDGWEAGLRGALLPGETVLAKAFIPGWASDSGTPSLWVVTDRRLLDISTTTSVALRVHARHVANLCGVTLCNSVFQSWLRYEWDAAGGHAEETVRFPLVAAGSFVRLFVALRQAMVSPYGFVSPADRDVGTKTIDELPDKAKG